VVLTILKNISQWEGLSDILWKIKAMFHQTTNQVTILVVFSSLLQNQPQDIATWLDPAARGPWKARSQVSKWHRSTPVAGRSYGILWNPREPCFELRDITVPLF
jgi:hypothetical protein